MANGKPIYNAADAINNAADASYESGAESNNHCFDYEICNAHIDCSRYPNCGNNPFDSLDHALYNETHDHAAYIYNSACNKLQDSDFDGMDYSTSINQAYNALVDDMVNSILDVAACLGYTVSNKLRDKVDTALDYTST